jgi:chromosome segregation ATPase
VTDQNGGPDSLILRYLRELDRKVDLLRDDMRDVKSRITALDAGLTLVNARLDRVENRLDRIERRLGLIEAPI